MEILYVIGMIAVFVLCLALLSTARRILRASPLSIAQASISRVYDGEQAEEDGPVEMTSAKLAPGVEASRFESTLAIDDPFEFETTAVAAVVEPVMAFESAPPVIHDFSNEWTEEDIPQKPQSSKWGWLPKPTRQTYNYALECVLLGVSAWVLIKTQQDTLRHRSAQPSRHRVA